ncbi:hypothetical protein OIU79_000073 [Salix purpurea]|uniref:Uncharacterized protein n=1 Tax=Salix purpurea TaxID=77065 RepID=A0A9Q0V176_SALPP|nr:hypothetical protein OIU79_000073 [Salix purpurea]
MKLLAEILCDLSDRSTGLLPEASPPDQVIFLTLHHRLYCGFPCSGRSSLVQDIQQFRPNHSGCLRSRSVVMNLASPKSPGRQIRSPSNRTLLAFTSLCRTTCSHSSSEEQMHATSLRI